MRLVYCHIENFGRLRNFDYEFGDGVNIICRENGWGKSTFSAFLRAMFYGFPGSRRKKTEENERERYRPWQGGIYGGRLVFETDGKKYEITRVFGRRESEDEFELRNPDSNLLCGDYSSKIGEELFRLDRESFSRTVFTGQQDCGAAATDDVNALVADLTERAGDMGNYEAALKRLTDTVSRLTPRRAGGSLARRAEEIKRLEREGAAGKELSKRLMVCEKKERDEAEREEDLSAELHFLSEQIKSADSEEEAARQALERETLYAGNREVRRRLCAVRDMRRKELEEALDVFPGRVPSRAEIEEQLTACREMERLEAKIQAEMPDEEEQQRLSELEEEFQDCMEDDVPLRETEKSGRAQMAENGNSVSGDPGETAINGGRKNGLFLLYIFPGAILLALGLIGTILTREPAFAILCVAGTAAVCAAIYFLQTKNGSANPSGSPSETRRQVNKDTANDAAKAALNTTRSNTVHTKSIHSNTVHTKRKEYLNLRRKEHRAEELYAKWSEIRRPVLRFLKELGFTPQEDLRTQLESLRNFADDCEDAGKLLREAERDLRAYESEMKSKNVPFASENGTADKISNISLNRKSKELRRRSEEIHRALLVCRGKKAEAERELEELRAEYEEWEYSMQRLEELRIRQKEEEVIYRRTAAAASNLQTAKEALTARYADPITGNFHRYWERITGYSAAGIHVDAESRVTVEERGKQRKIALLSAGYRDLAGICLRVALADAMYPPGRREKPPLIMDDPFTCLDDDKVQGAMRFLRETGENYQIIYFTCSAARC